MVLEYSVNLATFAIYRQYDYCGIFAFDDLFSVNVLNHSQCAELQINTVSVLREFLVLYKYGAV